MTETWHPAPRDVFEQSCHQALSRYKEAVTQGMWHVTADNQFVDQLLKAWEKSVLGTGRRDYAQRGVPRPAASPEAAAARLRELYGDTPGEQAARRADLDVYGVRRRA